MDPGRHIQSFHVVALGSACEYQCRSVEGCHLLRHKCASPSSRWLTSLRLYDRRQQSLGLELYADRDLQ